jgi:Uma2 family endonuclease
MKVRLMSERFRMTAAEFRELPETNTPVELIEGEIVMSPTPVYSHQQTVFTTAKWIDASARNGVTVISPMDVYLDEQTVLQPDIFWVGDSSENCRLRDGYWYGAPDLVIEVLSPSTAVKDRGVKFDLYEQHGVREYWLMEPQAQFIEVYTVRDQRFERLGLFEAAATFESSALQRRISVNDLFGNV